MHRAVPKRKPPRTTIRRRGGRAGSFGSRNVARAFIPGRCDSHSIFRHRNHHDARGSARTIAHVQSDGEIGLVELKSAEPGRELAIEKGAVTADRQLRLIASAYLRHRIGQQVEGCTRLDRERCRSIKQRHARPLAAEQWRGKACCVGFAMPVFAARSWWRRLSSAELPYS